jgi:hypothetical protein
MPKCTKDKIDFGRFGRRVIEADFSGGDLSSDGGLLLLRQVDRHLGLSRAAAAAIPDPRDPGRIRHGLRELLAQRLYGLCCGYEDLNDHKTLRSDVLMQTAVGRAEALASAPTFSRLESRATRAQAWALHGVLIEQFIASYNTAPEELVLDIDASDVPLHGDQELSQFHAYYDHHCYLPLYVFCGQAMLACNLRPSKIDGTKHAAALIKLLVTRLRRAWPNTRFIVRGDSGFCRRRLLQWCERSGVGYFIGLARNARLHAAVELAEAALADAYGASQTKQQAQLDLFGTRASCSRFIANQFRLLLAALAYTLMQRLRALALQASELERASAATVRVRLLKIGAAILRNTRRVRVMLASHHPLRELFATAARRLAALGP